MCAVNRIILNTGITYLRTSFAAIVGLFTARWVLLSLGEDAYGLYGLVGSILVFITFLNNVLAGAVSRYFAYSIGQKNSEVLNTWFNAAIRIHVFVPLILLAAGSVLGLFAIRYWLNIDSNDVNVAIKVFYVSLTASTVTMMTAPFKGLLLAKQDIAQQSVIEILQSFAHLLLMYILLTKVRNNQLIIYALMMASETIIFQLLIASRAVTLYGEIKIIRYPWYKLKSYVNELLAFSGWKSLMGFGQIAYNQGLAVILNVFFGTRMNASYSIASNLSAQSSTVSNSLMMAITPEIITRKGAGMHENMKSLSLKACRYSSYLVILIALPLFLDVDNILTMWLKDPPQYTDVLCRFILVSLFIDKIASGQESAVNACGKIKWFQISIALSYVVSVLSAYILLCVFRNPMVVGWSFLICSILNTFIRLYFGQSIADVKIKDWSVHVFVPLFASVLPVAVLSYMLMSLMPSEGFTRLVLIVMSTSVLFLITGWIFILDSTLKIKILNRIFKKNENS